MKNKPKKLSKELAKQLAISALILIAALVVLNLVALRFPNFALQADQAVAGYGLAGVFVVILFGTTLLPFPTDLFFVSMVKLHVFDVMGLVTVTIAAAFVAGLINYGIGTLLRKGVAVRFVDKKALHKAKEWFDAWGSWAILVFGVLPVNAVVDPLTIVAGFSGMALEKYIPVMLLARIIHFGILAAFGYYAVI
ncbi:MAG TPA: VTT domain-containing protein [Candidatus Norongarragalinales archaeon]|jgi:membrane protein YqaA with SNARE-associated domain|nr:VTT domain-containing protein [Candidatus Norongarragalinales archaeon]